MKKFNKVVAGMMVLGMGAGVAGALPVNNNTQTVSAQTSNSFTVSGFNTDLEIGESVTLPTVADATLTVTDPSGANVTLTGNVLTATKLGTYTVRYVKNIANSNGKSVQEYKVVVTGDKPTLKFSDNNSRIIPATTNFSKDIVLPVPTVESADGEEIENAEVTVSIAKPDHTTIEVTNAQLTATDGYALDVAIEGIYTITYKYVNSHNVIAYKTFQVNAKESYDSSNIKLVHSLKGTMPTSINLGSVVTLPSVTVKDENNSSEEVSAYYSIKVKNIASGNEYVVNADNEFTPMEEGAYKVTYTINDFFGSKLNGSEDNTYSYTIDKCEDNLRPEAMAVNAYTATKVGETSKVRVAVSDVKNAETSIVSKFYVTENADNTYTIPAIFGLDDYEVQKVTDGGVEYYEYDSSKFTLIRKLINSNGTTIKTWSSASTDVNANEAVTFDFKKSEGNYTGTYKVEYTVKDRASNTSSSLSYSFEVVEGLAADKDRSAPTITFDSYKPTLAKAGETISFAKPTVVDYLDASATDKVIGDTRVESSTYYYFNNDVASKVKIEEDKNNEDNLAFTLPKDLTGKTKLTVITYAKDDHNAETSNSFEIALVGGLTDNDAPQITSGDLVLNGNTLVAGEEDSINQLETVTINDITLTDADANFGASVNVRYFKNADDAIGTEIALSSVKTVYDKANKTITLKNASFVATNVGTYVVSVVGQDINGNTIVKSTSVKTVDVVAPEIVVNWNYTSISLNQAITLPQVKVFDNNELVANPKVTIEVEGPSYELNGYSFKALAKGDYSFKFVAEDNSGNKVESAVFTVYAEDTTAPTITLNEAFKETADLVIDNVTNKYTAVRLPGFVANDENGINWTETKVTVTNKSGNKVEVTSTADGAYEFVPTGNGSYTVNYVVVDNSGLKTTETYTVKVGDVVGPTITIGNTAKNKPGSKKVGDQLELDLSAITITDAKDANLIPDGEDKVTMEEALENSDINAHVYVYDPNGNIVTVTEEDERSYYKLEKQGQYRIEYRVTDENGNTTTETHTFTVNAKTTSPVISSETLGVILIAASLLLLGGVIVYFFATRKVVKAPKNTKRD